MLKKIKEFLQSWDFSDWLTFGIGILLTGMFYVLVRALMDDTFARELCVLFEFEKKHETLRFIALGIGGLLAFLGAIAINRRANAQVKNNELIEKGHIEERFKSATESLGSESAGVRMAAFYQFYYLAKDHPDDDFRENIFNVLCAYLRDMTNQKLYRVMEDDQQNKIIRNIPTEECQVLLNVLFKPEVKGEIVFAGFKAKLRGIYLMRADLEGANMSGADLENANMSGAEFCLSNLRHAHVTSANFLGAKMKKADLRNARFFRTNFQHAIMNSANLRNAYLGHAKLQHANLSEAELNCANLEQAKLLHANLCNADFSDANLLNADFRGAELSGAIFQNVRNLDTAKFDEGVKEIIQQTWLRSIK